MEQNKIEVQIDVECTKEELRIVEVIERALTVAAQREQLLFVEVSVVLVDDNAIQQLNNEYRKVDRPTDVLSFPLWENPSEWEEQELDILPLGDIVISFPKAKEQAQEYGHSLERELAFLAVHGFLHLIGYDHDTEEEEKKMFDRQDDILDEMGLKR